MPTPAHNQPNRCQQRAAGFTLIELVFAILLLGIMATVAGLGLSRGTRLYLISTENAQLSQKAQLAVARLSRELMTLSDIAHIDPDQPYLIYDHPSGRRAIAKVSDRIKIFTGLSGTQESLSSSELENQGHALIDRVAELSLVYRKGSVTGTPSPWIKGSDSIRELSAIDVQFSLTYQTLEVGPIEFALSVYPRNTNSYGGTVSPLPPDPPTKGQYCFIGLLTPSVGVRPVVIFTALAGLALLTLLGKRSRPWVDGLVGRPADWNRTEAPPNSSIDGSAMLWVLVTMFLFAGIAAVLLPLSSTTGVTRAMGNLTNRAYFLAESGHRVAASQYLNAGSQAAKNNALTGMHNQQYTLQDNAGGFELKVYPYYFYVTQDPQGGTSLATSVPGGLPDDLSLPANGRLSILSTIYDYNKVVVNDPQVTFTTVQNLPTINTGTNVLPVAGSVAHDQNVVKGGTIELAADSGDNFPLRNGQIVIDNHLYTYRHNDRSGDRLEGISDPEDDSMPPLTIPASSDITLSPFVRLQVTGIYGSGQTETRREVTYYEPLPGTWSQGHPVTYSDTMENDSAWTTVWGSHDVQAIGGNALRVTGVNLSVLDLPRVSLATLDWTDTPVDLERIYNSSDNFLSYDIQTKIGFVGTTPDPDWGYDPEAPYPKYYAAGLTFRLDNNFNAYGVTLLRGNVSLPSPYDNLNNNLVPKDDLHALVLWQWTGDGTTKNWIAYKQIGDLQHFAEDVESGENGWQATGLWNMDTYRSHSSDYAWYYGDPANRNYGTGGTTSGTLTSPTIDLGTCDYGRFYLRFWSWHETEIQNPNSWDIKTVEISTYEDDAWSEWAELYRLPAYPTSSDWQPIEADLSTYSGKVIRIRFNFDSKDALYNEFEGWYVDDIQVLADFPIDKATIAVRLRESAAIEFSDGGPDAINDGDRLQTTGGASAVAYGPTIVTSGTWAAGTAEGIIPVRKVVGTFQTGQRLQFVGASEVATIQGFSARENHIITYLGSQAGCGTASSNRFDNEKHANPRGQAELNWPPAEGQPWSAQMDYFTQIRWDALNPAVTSAELLNDTIIRSNEAVLLTLANGLDRSRPEIGLISMGKGAENVYFDDFGLTALAYDPLDIDVAIQE